MAAASSSRPPLLARHLNHPSLLNLHAGAARGQLPLSRRAIAQVVTEDENYDVSSCSSYHDTHTEEKASSVQPGQVTIEIPRTPDDSHDAGVGDAKRTIQDRIVDKISDTVEMASNRASSSVPHSLPRTHRKAKSPQRRQQQQQPAAAAAVERIVSETAYNEHRPYHHIPFPATLAELRQTGSDRYFSWVLLWILLLFFIGLAGSALTGVSGVLLASHANGTYVPFLHWLSIGHADARLKLFHMVYVCVSLALIALCPMVYIWYLRRLRRANNVNSLDFDERTVADRFGGAIGSSARSNALDLLKHQKNDHADVKPGQLRRSASLPDIVRHQGVAAFTHTSLSPPSSRSQQQQQPGSSDTNSPMRYLRRLDSVVEAAIDETVDVVHAVQDTTQQRARRSCCGGSASYGFVAWQVVGTLCFGVLLTAQFWINFQIQLLAAYTSSTMVAVILSLNLNVLNMAWQVVADRMTRSRGSGMLLSDYQNSMAKKTFFFRLCTTVVLISLTRGALSNQVVSNTCQSDQLSQQYVISLWTDIGVSFLVGIVFGWVQRRVLWCLCRKSRSGDNRYNPEFSFLEEYDDIVRKLQLMMFALPVTPLFPMCMALVLLLEYYMDQYKLLRLCKPIPAMQSNFHWTLAFIIWMNIIVSVFIPNGTFWILQEWYSIDTSLCPLV